MNRRFFCVCAVLFFTVCSVYARSYALSFDEAESIWALISSGDGKKTCFFNGKTLYEIRKEGSYEGVCSKTAIKEVEFEGEDKNVDVKKVHTVDQSGSNFILMELANGSFYLFYSYRSSDFELVKIPQMKDAQQVDCTVSPYEMFRSFFIKNDRMYCASFSYEDKKLNVQPFPFFEKALSYKAMCAVTTSMGYCLYESKSGYGINFFSVRKNGIDVGDSGLFFPEKPEIFLSYGPDSLYSVAVNCRDELYVFENNISEMRNKLVYRKKGIRNMSSFIDYDLSRRDEAEALFIYEYENEDGVKCFDVSSLEKNYYHAENTGAVSIFPNYTETGLFNFILQRGNSVVSEGIYRNYLYYDWYEKIEGCDRFCMNDTEVIDNGFLFKSYPLFILFVGIFDDDGKMNSLAVSKKNMEWYTDFDDNEDISRELFDVFASHGKNSECIRVVSRRIFCIRDVQTGCDVIYEIYGEYGNYFLRKYQSKGRVISMLKDKYILVANDMDEFKVPEILNLYEIFEHKGF